LIEKKKEKKSKVVKCPFCFSLFPSFGRGGPQR